MLFRFKSCLFLQHCAGVNCLAVLKSLPPDGCDYLFTGSRDGTLKRWALTDNGATFSTTFESHVDWVYIPTPNHGFHSACIMKNHLFYLCVACCYCYRIVISCHFTSSILL